MTTVKIIEDGVEVGSFEVPDAPQRWDAFAFKKRFTADERKSIRALAAVNADIYDFLDMLDTAGMTGTMIVASDAMLNAALDALTLGGLLSQGRKAEILSA